MELIAIGEQVFAVESITKKRIRKVHDVANAYEKCTLFSSRNVLCMPCYFLFWNDTYLQSAATAFFCSQFGNESRVNNTLPKLAYNFGTAQLHVVCKVQCIARLLTCSIFTHLLKFANFALSISNRKRCRWMGWERSACHHRHRCAFGSKNRSF